MPYGSELIPYAAPVVVSVASRVGPLIGRISRSSPKFMGLLTDRLAKGAKRSFSGGVKSVIEYAKSNKVAMFMTASTLASLGADVGELFAGHEDEPDVKEVLRHLGSMNGADSEATKAAMFRIANMAAVSETANDETDEFYIQTIGWARSFAGSDAAAIKFHQNLQAFVEIPISTVREKMRTLNFNGRRSS